MEKTNEELIIDPFMLKNVIIKGLIQMLQYVARKYEVTIKQNVPNILVKGCQGEPKGLIQIIWKRGFIDPSIPRIYFVMKVTRDDNHNIRTDY